MRKKIFPAFVIFCSFTLGCERNEILSGNAGVTFSNIVEEGGGNYRLDGNIVNYSEIEGYDSATCVFLLSEAAGKKIRDKKYPVSPTHFAIAENGEIIYIANFIPGYSSISCEECISVEPYSYDNKYSIRLGYPGSYSFPGADPRNDKRIIQIWKRDKKLMEIPE